MPPVQPVPKSLPPIQAADLLAWEGFNALKKTSSPLRRTFNMLVKNSPWLSGVFYEKDLLKACAEAGAPKRDNLQPDDPITYHSEPKRPRRRTIK